MKDTNFRSARTVAVVIVGNFIYALVVKLFLLPGNLMTGGTTGIALIVNHVTGLSIPLFVFVFNIVMLAVGFALLGRHFALSTILSSVTYPVALEFLDRTLGDVALTEDLILNTVFFGLGIGLSLGMVIRTGASTGGMDIPPLVLNKYFHVPVSVGLYVFDFLILVGQIFYNSIDRVLYGIILIMVYTVVLDKVMLMGTTKTEVKIISKNIEEIRMGILSQVDRGVTLLHGQGGYLNEETEVALSIVFNRELPRVERLVRDIDPEAFMIVSRVTEVRGRGFSISKDYSKKEKEET